MRGPILSEPQQTQKISMKVLKLLALAAVAVSLSFGLVSCAKKQAPATTTTPGYVEYGK